VIEHVAVDIAGLTCAIVAISRAFGDSRPWWRGHADAEWLLVPSLYRRGSANKEGNLNARFRLMAKVRHPDCPGNDNALPWLFLMQHYRLPTRLLDWSESPLVALYFALEEATCEHVDAALWALMPTKLNLQQLGREAILMPGSTDLGRLSVEAFVRNAVNPDVRILAVLTEQSDLRHMVQQSAFTIHGCDSPIDGVPGSGSFLARIRIPAAMKPGFRQVLALYGISRATVPGSRKLGAGTWGA
jgi:hypothetical protein